MNIVSFQDLKVWQKAHDLTLNIYKVTRNFPMEEKFGLTNQIRRSTSSICANITEGYRKSRRDFVRYLDISMGSLEETKYHLLLSKDLDYLNKEKFIELTQLAEEIGKMLNRLITKLRN
jgi:four helix bundle protein